ncbi:hypothetical protein HDV03_002219 [Kappamyces sp. JEL0829]|nr:hypothetical protein HDV03_002219 [Kappamyces sp. JEL0829]
MSFLLQLCDFHLCYAGCENIDEMVLVNSVFLWLWVVLGLMCCAFPLERIYSYLVNKKPMRSLVNFHMKVCMLLIVVIASKIVFLATSRKINSSVHLTGSEVQQLVLATIIAEMVYICLSALVSILYSHFIIVSFSTRKAASWISHGIHSVIVVAFIGSFLCFALLGTTGSLNDYVGDSFIADVPVFIYVSGTRVIAEMLKNDGADEDRESKLKAIKKKIIRLKAGISGHIRGSVFGGTSFLLIAILNEIFAGSSTGLLASKITLHILFLPSITLPVYSYFFPTVLKIMGRAKRTDDKGSSKTNSGDGYLSSKEKGQSRQGRGTSGKAASAASNQIALTSPASTSELKTVFMGKRS